jgi:hypothetical protein
VVLTARPEEFVADPLQGHTAVGMAVMYVGDPDEGAGVVSGLKDLAPTVDLIQPMPYTAFQAMLDPTAPPGMRSYWRGEYLDHLDADAIVCSSLRPPAWCDRATPLSRPQPTAVDAPQQDAGAEDGSTPDSRPCRTGSPARQPRCAAWSRDLKMGWGWTRRRRSASPNFPEICP